MQLRPVLHLAVASLASFASLVFMASKTITVTNIDDERMTVKVGDVLGFKSDIEQSGVVTGWSRNWNGGVEFHLSADEDGFDGDYIGGSNSTTQSASRCWPEWSAPEVEEKPVAKKAAAKKPAKKSNRQALIKALRKEVNQVSAANAWHMNMSELKAAAKNHGIKHSL